MAEVFTEESVPLSDGHLVQLLRRNGFCALAAFAENDIIGEVGVLGGRRTIIRCSGFEL
jgi:hypothetical protein